MTERGREGLHEVLVEVFYVCVAVDSLPLS